MRFCSIYLSQVIIVKFVYALIKIHHEFIMKNLGRSRERNVLTFEFLVPLYYTIVLYKL